ncbi:MAG: PLP-dependent transferase [Chromatiales bacterium]|nr:PLP-dependent transferase [Chromatiales bacterium]
MSRQRKFPTQCIHAGETVDPATGGVMPAIHTSTTYEYERFGVPREHLYTRASNPTRDALERCIAELEGGERALAYASGQAATSAVLDLLDAGAHVIVPQDFYAGTCRLLTQVRSRTSGLSISSVDCTDLDQLAAAIRPETRLIWLESPTNPRLRIIDVAAVVALARERGILVCIDNTFATPCLQRPLEWGVDIVMHSATKYMGGHSDVLGGINVTRDQALGRKLAGLRSASGGVLGPFDAYLALRGIKTLALRMERHCANALGLAQWLSTDSRVAEVIYPGLPDHPQHALARRQMSAFGAIIGLRLRAGEPGVGPFLDRLELFALAESLGGVESLVGHPATMSHSAVTAEQARAMGVTPDLIRLSVGIEDIDDLKADLDQALSWR